MQPQFRNAILIVLILVVVSAGFLLWQNQQSGSDSNTNTGQIFTGDVDALAQLEEEFAEYENEAATIGLLSASLDDLASDDVPAPVSADDLSNDLTELEAIESIDAEQGDDQAAVDDSFTEFSDLRN